MKIQALIDRFTEQADLQDENIPLQPLVEIYGEHRVLIENHYGVCTYSGEEIGVCVRFGTIRVLGNDLRLCFMSRCKLVITGRIAEIRLKRRK